MTKHKRHEFDPEEEMYREIAFGKYCDSFPSAEAWFRAINPMRTDPYDFQDNEQEEAWKRALQEIGKGSSVGLVEFLELGKPVSARISLALAHILKGSNLAAPNELGEIERTLRVKSEIKSARAAHRPSDPATTDKAFAVARRVVERLKDEPEATPTDVIAELAEKAKASPRNVWSAYRTLKETRRK